MYHLSKHITLPFLAMAVLIVVSLACSPTGALPGGGAQGQPTQASGAQATPVSQPTSAATGKQPTATSTSGTKPGVFPEIADLKSLSSYRSTITSKGADDKGAERTSVIVTEWVKEPSAQHITMKDGDKVTSEIVTIGDKRWMWMPTLGWREMPPQPERPSDLPSDLESQIKKMQSDLSQAKPTFTLLGTETIDGIRCKYYKFDIQFSMDLPNLASGGTRKAEIHSSGEMWVADQSGLPAIIIQSKETMEMNLSGQKTVTQAERKVYDINKPITIKPPEGAKPMPGGPTPPASKTPPPL